MSNLQDLLSESYLACYKRRVTDKYWICSNPISSMKEANEWLGKQYKELDDAGLLSPTILSTIIPHSVHLFAETNYLNSLLYKNNASDLINALNREMKIK